MPLSTGGEMTDQHHTQTYGNREDRYATREDFQKIVDEGLNGLYQMSFLLTGDHQKAEKCLVAGIEDCAKQNHVFREWARVWAKRVIAENAIRELNPKPRHSSLSSVSTSLHNQQISGRVGHFDVDAVLGLADFERFVFVLCVLEHYREHEGALLLGCSAREVREARTRAIAELASLRQVVFAGRKTANASLAEAPKV
jgi:DNA-directed RNA polymerase specialized sigma24 family protein